MIHTLFVSAKTSLDELKKEFRKKLMTGGAVIRLEPNLSDEDLWEIFNNFVVNPLPETSVNTLVLAEIAKSEISPPLLMTIAELPAVDVIEALLERSDLESDLRKKLIMRLPAHRQERLGDSDVSPAI